MNRRSAAAALIACALTSPPAVAFPLLIAGAGTGLLGVAFLPIVVVMLIIWAAFTTSGDAKRLLVMVCLVGVGASSATYFAITPSWNKQITELLSEAASGQTFQVNVRFEYLDDSKQQALSQALRPDEFAHGFLNGDYQVIWLDKSRVNIFRDFGNRFAVEEVSDDPNPLIEAIEASTKPVVLIDETGSLSSSVSRDIAEHFGVKSRFLLGGTSKLNTELWRNWTISDDPQAYPFDQWQKQSKDKQIASLVVLDEFLLEGWMHGEIVTTMAGYLAGIERVASTLKGAPVLISGAENTFTGHTWLLVRKLRAMGLDVSYIKPTREEKLVKQPYISAFQGADRMMPLDAALLLSEIMRGITFVDVRPTHEAISLADDYDVAQISMETIAKGGVASAVSRLPRHGYFMGLAYDKRTYYHSLLVGEQVVQNGGHWLGVAVHPSVYDQDLTELTFLEAPIGYSRVAVPAWLGSVGVMIVGERGEKGILIAALIGLLLGVSRQIQNRNARWIIYAFLALTYQAVDLADGWLITHSYSTGSLLLALGVAAWFGLYAGKTFSLSQKQIEATIQLPPKISLLKKAKSLGYNVLHMLVINRQILDRQSPEPFISPSGHLVRSASFDESIGSGSTGIFESVRVAAGEDVWPAARKVLDQIGMLEHNPHCFIQPLIYEAAFGVVMFGTGPDAHLILGEAGEGDSITAGRPGYGALATPIWDLADVPALWIKPVRALLGLRASLGATSIEFALSPAGEFTLLQVNVDSDGRASLAVIEQSISSRFMFDPLIHRSPTEAAIYAAFAMPGEQVSIANRRLIIERRVLNSWKDFAADLQAVTGRFHPLMLVAPPADEIDSTFAEAHSKRRLVTAATQPDLDGSTESLVGFVINQVEQVRDLYGRYSRLSTLASELLSARSGLSISEKMIVVKEACSRAFAFEAERLVPWLVEIHARGAGEELRNLLGTCLAEEMTASAIGLANGSEQVVTIRNLFGDMPESGSTNRCWGIPADGLKINLSPPETFQNGDALLIQDTDISHLHLLATAKAIVATKGSTLSHLMQHARLLRIPYIVGASVDLVGEGGMAVTLTSQGEILHA